MSTAAHPRALPLHAWLSPRRGDRIDAHQIAERIAAAFLQSVIDWQRGDIAVQDIIDYMTHLGVPEVIIAPVSLQFGHTVHISVSFPQWPGHVATFLSQPQACPMIRLDAEPFDLAFLKHAALEIADVLGCYCNLQSDILRGIASRTVHGAIGDPLAAVRWHYDASNFPTIELVELGDWRRIVRDAALRWLAEKDNVTWRANTRAGFDSSAAYADALVAEVEAIGPVARIWSIRVAAPFAGAMLLDQGEWHTSINLSGIPGADGQ